MLFSRYQKLSAPLLALFFIVVLVVLSKNSWPQVTSIAHHIQTIPHSSTGSDIATSRSFQQTTFSGGGDLKDYPKPPYRISALIFAGRQEFLSILDCYLKRNLVRNGGWLDEVLWIIRTDSEADQKYLHDLVEATPEYVSRIVRTKEERIYRNLYSDCRSDTIYVKIDDDVVFFEDHAIPAIVKRLVENPQYSVVSANIMNQPALAWVHYHLNVVLPFAPEPEKPLAYQDLDTQHSNIDWRPSSLPPWTGPEDFDFSFPMINPAPFKHHRWLRLPENSDIEKTPIGIMGEGSHEQYIANSTAYKSWTIAAQQHYSFLTHLENDELYRYKFDLWNYHYDRLTINFLAFWGKDIVENGVTGSDEQYLTVTLPKKLRRPAVLDGAAMAVHFGFHRQVYGHGGPPGQALNDTDLIFRYRSFADEYICEKPLRSYRPG